MNYSKEIFICECNSTEHQMVFLYDKEDVNSPSVYVHIHLAKKSFLERLRYGVKYILGYQSRYGAFDEFILNPDDIDKLKNVVKYLKQNKKS